MAVVLPGDSEEQKKEESAAIMVTQADGPIDREAQAVLLYLYSKDLPGPRKRVLAAGVDASEIVPRFYMEKGEMACDRSGWVRGASGAGATDPHVPSRADAGHWSI